MKPLLLASASAFALMLASDASFAQQALPAIDVGAASSGAAGSRIPSDEGVSGRRVTGVLAGQRKPIGDTRSYAVPAAGSGTRTETPVMETPLNVQVVSEQVIRDQQIIRLEDSLKNVSGVTMLSANAAGRSAGGSFILRGFATTSYFRNGVRLGFAEADTGTSGQQMANVERVEVLKGPAAILYGIVEPGGMVNVITKQPQEKARYSAQQQFGSFGLWRTTMDATGPLTSDKSILYRANVSYENASTFVDLTHRDSIFVAPVIKWNIDASTQVTGEFEYNNYREGQYSSFSTTFNGRNVPVPRNRNYGEYDPDRAERVLFGINWSHKFNEGWTFSHSTLYLRKHSQSLNIIPFLTEDTGTQVLAHRVALPMFYALDQFSTNPNLTGRFDTGELHHVFLLGGDYYRYNYWRKNSFTAGDSVIDQLNPIHPGTAFGPQAPRDATANTTYDYGLYVQDQIKLPFGVHLTGGVRYQNTGQLSRTNTPWSAWYIGVSNTSLRAQRVTPRVGALWRPVAWLSVYGNYTENFGPNSAIMADLKPVPPSDARQWEAGAKVEVFEGRIRATGAYYNLTKTNVPTPDLRSPGYWTVAGEVRAKGVEFDLQGEVLPGWDMIATYSNTDTKVTKTEGDDLGERFVGVPRNTASLWSAFSFGPGALSGLKFGGGFSYRDGQRMSDYTGLKLRENLPSYATFDMMGSYEFILGATKVTAQLNVTNLFDRHYYVNGANWVTPVPKFLNGDLITPAPGWNNGGRVYGEPRAFRGSLAVAF